MWDDVVYCRGEVYYPSGLWVRPPGVSCAGSLMVRGRAPDTFELVLTSEVVVSFCEHSTYLWKETILPKMLIFFIRRCICLDCYKLLSGLFITKLDSYFWGFLPQPRAQTRLVGQSANIRTGGLAQWLWGQSGILRTMRFWAFLVIGSKRHTVAASLTAVVSLDGSTKLSNCFNGTSLICCTLSPSSFVFLINPELWNQNY